MDISRCLNKLLPGAQFSIDANGATGLQGITGPTGPLGSAGGDLGGIYPNPTVTHIQGDSVSSAIPSMEQICSMNEQLISEDSNLEALNIKYGHIPTFLDKLCKKLNIRNIDII